MRATSEYNPLAKTWFDTPCKCCKDGRKAQAKMPQNRDNKAVKTVQQEVNTACKNEVW